MSNKLMTEEQVVAELRSGMTIGIGGWGSRRKPMSLVRALLRSDLRDLTVVAYGGPDVGLLCAAGKVKRLVYGFVSLDSIALEPHFRAARQAGAIEIGRVRRGHALLGPVRGRQPAAVPAHPRGPGLRRDAHQPRAENDRLALWRRRGADRDARARDSTPRSSTSTAPTPPATPSSSAPTRTSTSSSAWPPSAPTSPPSGSCRPAS